MGDLSKVSVDLPAELEELVRQAVATGDYATGSDVVREALVEWQQWRIMRERDCTELRALWQEGLASGPGKFNDMASIKLEARRRLDAGSAEPA